MIESVSIFISTATNSVANHANPIVFRCFTILAMCYNILIDFAFENGACFACLNIFRCNWCLHILRWESGDIKL